MTPPQEIGRRGIILGSAAAITSTTALTTAGSAQAAVRPKRRTDFAIWDPIDNRSTATLNPRRVTMHIAVTNSADIYGPNKGPGGSYAHFYNPVSGRPRQHQYMTLRAAADLDGNGTTISVEHQGMPGDAMSANQKTNLAKIFAWAVVYCGVPNRIASPGNVNGLAWHRLGISGNFGPFDPNVRTTWSRAQTGAVWSSATGKTCPTDRFIRQIGNIYDEAQTWVQRYRNPPPAV